MKSVFLLLSVVLAFPAFAASRMVYLNETDKERQIWLADGDGKSAKPLTEGTLWHLYPELDATGRWMVYVEAKDEKQSQILLRDLETGVTEVLTDGPGQKLHPDLSGNGRRIAFSTPVEGKSIPQILIADINLSRKSGEKNGEKKLSKDDVVESQYPSYFPALSSDGEFLVYQENTSPFKQIVYYEVASKKSKVLSPANLNSMSPSLSFDDRYVAFTGQVSGKDGAKNWEIYVADLRKGDVKRLTDNPAQDLAPTFRYDGSLVFSSDRDGGKLQFYSISAKELLSKESRVDLFLKGEGNVYSPSFSGELAPKQSMLHDIPAPARSSFGSVVSNGKVVVIGGHQGEEHTYPPESFSSQVDLYDLQTGEWTKGTDRPHAAHGFGLAANGKYVYAFGGFAFSDEFNPKWHSLDDIDRYDVEADEWVTIGKLPRRRSSNVVAVVGKKVYLIGGWDSTPKFNKDFDGVFHKEIDVFDLETEKIETLEISLPNPLRRALTSVVVGDTVLLIGGISEGATHFNLIDNVTAFDTKTGKFAELPKLPFATFAPAAGAIGNRLWVFGGMYRNSPEDFVYVNHIYSLDLAALSGARTEWSNSGRYLYESKGFSQVVNLSPTVLGILGGHSYQGNNAPVATFESFEAPVR